MKNRFSPIIFLLLCLHINALAIQQPTTVIRNAVKQTLTPSEIGSALDNTTLTWRSSYGTAWITTTNKSYNNKGNSVANGNVTNFLGPRVLSTDLKNKGEINFWILVNDYYLDLFITTENGLNYYTNWTTTKGWQNVIIPISEYNATISWTYNENLEHTGEIYIDNVTYYPEGTIPTFITEPNDTNIEEGKTLYLFAKANTLANYQWYYNNNLLQDETNNELTITEAKPQQSGNYILVINNEFGTNQTHNINVNIIAHPNLNEALDTQDIYWNTTGTKWYGQYDEYIKNGSSAQSGKQNQNESYTAILNTTIKGKGSLSYKWKAAGTYNDEFNVKINGQLAEKLNPTENTWNNNTIQLTDNINTIEWQFSHTGYISNGTNTVWIDDIYFTPEEELQVFPTEQPTIKKQQITSTGFLIEISTKIGHTYSLEFTDDLNNKDWLELTNIIGTGNPEILTDRNTTNQQRFYRIKTQ